MVKDIAFGIIISLLFVSLVILFCVVVIKLYIQKIKKYNEQLYQNEIDFQKTLTSTILETQEQLLNSISQELHDAAGQQLTVINFQLENMKLDHPNCENEISPISNSVRYLSQTLRAVSHSLNSNWLSDNGLINAISKEVLRLQKNKTIVISLHKEESVVKNFESDVQIVIFRIFQEIINNILKHADATKIDITLRTQPAFQIIIQDNGIGFENIMLENTNSIGLKNCASRAKMIHYTFEIKSQLSIGTTVILQETV